MEITNEYPQPSIGELLFHLLRHKSLLNAQNTITDFRTFYRTQITCTTNPDTIISARQKLATFYDTAIPLDTTVFNMIHKSILAPGGDLLNFDHHTTLNAPDGRLILFKYNLDNEGGIGTYKLEWGGGNEWFPFIYPPNNKTNIFPPFER